jgi:putative FmdB family regulatory protein
MYRTTVSGLCPDRPHADDMPLYEYQCDECGHRFERIQKFSDPPASECPRCGGRVQKQVSSPAFQFKGSGWYVTDYARKSDTARGDKGDSKPEESGGASKEASKEPAPKDGGAKESPSKPASDGPTTSTTKSS